MVPGRPRPPRPDLPTATSTPLTLTTSHGRKSGGVIAAGGEDAPYNYAPSVLSDGGRYRMWWCSQLGVAKPPGDDILLAESTLDERPIHGPRRQAGHPGLLRRGPAASTACTPATRR